MAQKITYQALPLQQFLPLDTNAQFLPMQYVPLETHAQALPMQYVPLDKAQMFAARGTHLARVASASRLQKNTPEAVHCTPLARVASASRLQVRNPDAVHCPPLTRAASASRLQIHNPEALRIDLEIQVPIKEAPAVEIAPPRNSLLCNVLLQRKVVEPVYFQNVDCVGLPSFLTPIECKRIIDFAESQGFRRQHRERLLDMNWSDIVDPSFAEAIWDRCGLERFLRNITIEGMVPYGLNDVIRIQKYSRGCKFGRHRDQSVQYQDDEICKVSKYSLRVFLNGQDDMWFEGGLSMFHVPCRQDPVVFEPETGLALVYPQGDRCQIQEEAEVTDGVKYVLRADILFYKPENVEDFL